MQKQFININFDTKSTQEDGVFLGYASVFNNVDNNNDVILPNAFINLEVNKIKFLWQHDTAQPIGKITKVSQDQRGLLVEGKISLESQKGREAYALLKEGTVEGLSIGFEVKDSFYKDKYRYITKIKLWEVSLVTFPANEEAKVLEIKNNSEANHIITQGIESLIAIKAMIENIPQC